MPIKDVDWHSEHELENERLALLYPAHSNASPQLEGLTRLRMKMLKKLFNQMNVEFAPAKRYIASLAFGLQEQEAVEHPLLIKLLGHLVKLQEQSGAFLDNDPFRELDGAKLDGPEMYILSKSRVSSSYALFNCNPAESMVQRVKQAESGIWSRLFDPDLLQGTADGAVFVTAKINRTIPLSGERGCRLILVEGGRLTERLALCTNKFGWTIQPVAAYYELAVNDLLEIDGYYEVVLSCLILKEVN